MEAEWANANRRAISPSTWASSNVLSGEGERKKNKKRKEKRDTGENK